jgi:tetratricopeptide (TPR) repeat protein
VKRSFALAAALLVAALPAVAAEPAAASPANAPYQFTLAKMLAAEGALVEALAAFEEAERLAPESEDSAYVRLEHAELLARLAQVTRGGPGRGEYLRKAADQLSRARQLAPANLDVLRAVGDVYVDLAADDPTALATARDALEEVRRRDPRDVQSALALGRLYLDQQQPDKAAAVLRDLVAHVPQQRTAYAFLVEALLRAQKTKEAEAALAEILAADPASIEARLTLAELEEQRGDQRAALATLQAAPEEVRADPRLRRQLAWSLYFNGDPEGALAVATPLVGGGGDDARPMALLEGLAFAALGRNAEALALLAKLRETQPGNLPLTLTLSRVLQRDGRRAEAARLLGELADRLVQDGKAKEALEVRFEVAQLWAGGKEWEKVVQETSPLVAGGDEALRLQARLLLADALAELKRYDEALAQLATAPPPPATTAAPLPAAILGKRAEVLLRAGREEEARRQLADLAGSGEPEAVLIAAQSWQRRERYTESIPLLERLLERRADLAPAAFLLGAAYERTGRREQAVVEMRRVLAIDPNFHAALNYLGYMFAEVGENLDEALTLVRRAVALDPDNGAYVDSLGWTFFRLGRFDQARGYLERATRLEPEDATVHEHLGDVYVALGQTERAREVYRRALALGNGNAKQVQQKLDNLAAAPRRP